MEILGYISLFLVGILLGTLGAGGSILAVPVLVYLFSLDVVLATAYSLFIVGSTSLLGSFMKFRNNSISIYTSLIFGIPSMISVFITRHWLIPNLPGVIYRSSEFIVSRQSVIMILLSILMIFSSMNILGHVYSKPKDHNKSGILQIMFAGILSGVLTGLTGAGGGFIIIPLLIYFTDLPYKSVVGTTLMIISFNALLGFTSDLLNRLIYWPSLLILCSLSVVGMVSGSLLFDKFSSNNLRKGFGGFMLLTGMAIFLKEIILIFSANPCPQGQF